MDDSTTRLDASSRSVHWFWANFRPTGSNPESHISSGQVLVNGETVQVGFSTKLSRNATQTRRFAGVGAFRVSGRKLRNSVTAGERSRATLTQNITSIYHSRQICNPKFSKRSNTQSRSTPGRLSLSLRSPRLSPSGADVRSYSKARRTRILSWTKNILRRTSWPKLGE
jgi:hypothetical protein